MWIGTRCTITRGRTWELWVPQSLVHQFLHMSWAQLIKKRLQRHSVIYLRIPVDLLCGWCCACNAIHVLFRLGSWHQ